VFNNNNNLKRKLNIFNVLYVDKKKERSFLYHVYTLIVVSNARIPLINVQFVELKSIENKQ
jgi:hypothetical protein